MPDLDDITWAFPAGGSRYAGLRSNDDDMGPFVRDTLHSTTRREFALVAPLATAAEATTLRGLWVSTRGGAGTTTLTPPGGGSPLTVEFIGPPTVVMESHDQYRLTVTVREVA